MVSRRQLTSLAVRAWPTWQAPLLAASSIAKARTESLRSTARTSGTGTVTMLNSTFDATKTASEVSAATRHTSVPSLLWGRLCFP